MKRWFVWSRLAILSGAVALAQTNPPSPTLVARYCAGCHNDNLKSGTFSFARFDLIHPEQNADQAEKVIRKVRAGLMPPPGLPRPDAAQMKAFAAALETSIDQAAAAHPNPGRPALHRLNRCLGRPVRGHDDHGKLRINLAQFLEHVEPGAIGEPHIEQHGVGLFALDQVDSCGAALRGHDP